MAKRDSPLRSLIVQPDDGVSPVLDLMAAAQRTLTIKQFTLDQPRIVREIMDAHRRKVAVRVMLNPHRSSGDRANDKTYAALKRAKVPVQWTNPAFAVTHEKSMVIDGARALIATFNFVDKYFTETRDYGVVTYDRREVAQVVAGFEADWKRKPFAPDERVRAPVEHHELAPDHGALHRRRRRRRLGIQHPSSSTPPSSSRLVDAHARGVHVKVLCGGKHGISDTDIPDTFSSLRILDRFGIKVHRQKRPKLHAKLLIADDERALIGSMNIDRSAFDLRRELGIVVVDGPILKRLGKVYDQDWGDSHHWKPPDPLDVSGHHEGELPHDPHFVHE